MSNFIEELKEKYPPTVADEYNKVKRILKSKLEEAYSMGKTCVWFQASTSDMKRLMEDQELQGLKFKDSNKKTDIIGHVAKLVCID